MFNSASSDNDTSVDSKNNELIEALSSFGLFALVASGNLFKDERTFKILYNKFIMEKYSTTLMEESNLNNICSRAVHNNINLYQHPLWSEFLDARFEAGFKDHRILYQAFRSRDHYINYYLAWKQDVNWMQVYNAYFSMQKDSGYVTEPFHNALNKYFAQNPLCARISIEADLFDAETKPDSYVRTAMYVAYIRAGFLDKKKARKIRSESSEYTSMRCVDFLLEVSEENPSLYPNIDELLFQFIDTRHETVQTTIASRAPYRLLYAFVGFESKEAKRILEKRMQSGT